MSEYPIYLYNTLTRRKEEFTPGEPGRVGMYTGGPTVYQYASIGNFRTYVFSDILRRTLEYNGLAVKQVMNVTDVGHLVSDAGMRARTRCSSPRSASRRAHGRSLLFHRGLCAGHGKAEH
jgi:cysteinyl-tRNA synthetase